MIETNGSKPLISVIIPTLNCAETLGATLESVLNQRYDHKEIVVMDGASTDTTDSVLRDFEDRIDVIVSEQDAGVYDAMNKGLDRAHGDWVLFLGSDDLLVDVLHRIWGRLKIDQNSVVYGNVYWKKKNRVYDGEFKWYKLIEKNVCQQAVFYPKSVFDDLRFNLSYPVLADWDLNLRLWADPRFKKRYVNELIAIYAGGGLSQQRIDDAFLSRRGQVIKDLFGPRLAGRALLHRFLRVLAGGKNRFGRA